MSVTHTSPASAKIELFRALFRGHEEVYPRHFESAKSGKAGYSPVCGNEWVRGVCEKPRIKCNDCPHQRRLPVTDDVVRCHLSGADDRRRDFVAGVYPMLSGHENSCAGREVAACWTQPPYAENHAYGGVRGLMGAFPSVRPDRLL